MARFTPQPFGLGPIFPISASFVANRHPVCVAPLSLNSEKLAPSAAHAKVHNRLWNILWFQAQLWGRFGFNVSGASMSLHFYTGCNRVRLQPNERIKENDHVHFQTRSN